MVNIGENVGQKVADAINEAIRRRQNFDTAELTNNLIEAVEDFFDEYGLNENENDSELQNALDEARNM